MLKTNPCSNDLGHCSLELRVEGAGSTRAEQVFGGGGDEARVQGSQCSQKVGSREHHGGRRSAPIAALWALTDGRWRREARGLRGCIQRRIEGPGWRPALNQLILAGDAVTHEFFSARFPQSPAPFLHRRQCRRCCLPKADCCDCAQTEPLPYTVAPTRQSVGVPRGHGCAKRCCQLAVVACFWSPAGLGLDSGETRLGMSASPSCVLSHKTHN